MPELSISKGTNTMILSVVYEEDITGVPQEILLRDLGKFLVQATEVNT